jgi:cysteine desulfurase family protein (TIGR01976 family)
MSTAAGLDVQALRARFPGLRDDVAHLDGPGGSQVPAEVIEAMASYLRDRNANLGGAFEASRASDEVVNEGRRAAADFLRCAPEEIAFGANMTTLNFLLAHAVARTLRPGDEIVTTALDHDGNISPWLLAAADHQLVVREVDILEPDLTIDFEGLEDVLSERTKVVAFTLASNAVGTIPDAQAISEAAHRVGALAWADGVHYAPHRRIDVESIGADVLLCSPYKFFGPHQGIAYGRADLLASLPADRVRPAGQEPPGHRFETGTLSHEAVAGSIAAIEYLASLGEGLDRRSRLDDAFVRIRGHEEGLTARFLEGLRDLDGVELFGIADPARVGERTPTFAVTIAGVTPRAAAEALAADRIAAWDGNYYALALMERLGLESRGGALRLGFLHYTTAAEVDRALAAIGRLTG